MPWIIAAVALAILLCLFPRRAWLLVAILACAASAIWGGIAAYNLWQDSLIRRIEISVRLPQYPADGAAPADWKESGKLAELQEAWKQEGTPEQKKRRVNRIAYGCARENPLIADVRNGNGSALLRCTVAIEAFQPGRSTNVAGRFQTSFDTIIAPGERKLVCLPAPRLSGGLAQEDVEFRARPKDALFD